MRKLLILCLCVAAVSAYGQAIPPINLQGEVLNGGQVSLSWDPPPEGLVEDFNDGQAQGFQFQMYEGSYVIEDGWAKLNALPNVTPHWGSAVYTPVGFDDCTVEVTYQYQSGTSSRGLLFRADGPLDADANLYGFWTSGSMYSIWKCVNGSFSAVYNWTTSNLINPTGTNTLKLIAAGNSFDMYINGTFVATGTDNSFSSGYAGIVLAYGSQVWYDGISCFFGAQPSPPGPDEDQPGTPVQGRFDAMGTALDDVARMEQQQQLQLTTDDLSDPDADEQNELDEFVEYRVYRDGGFVGATTMESFTDQLPSLGDHVYTVSAYYDPEGESSPAGPLTLTWSALILDLAGQIVVVPPEGGYVYYDATLVNTLQRTFQGVNYWTSIQLPNQQQFGPMDFRTVTIPGFLNVTITALLQNIPALAPPGEYVLTGHLGHYPDSQLSDSFAFTKQGEESDSFEFDPEDWVPGGEFAIEAGDGVRVIESPPPAYRLSEAYPNPFNSSAGFEVTLPDAGELSVAVYNLRGQLVTTLANGSAGAGTHRFSFEASQHASGLYLIRATVPGRMDEIRKAWLLR